MNAPGTFEIESTPAAHALPPALQAGAGRAVQVAAKRTAAPAVTVSNSEFLRAVYGDMDPGMHGWVCSFAADPAHAPPTVWGGRAYKGLPNQAGLIDRAGQDNAYFCTAELGATEDGEIVRGKDAFKRLAVLLADDVDMGTLYGDPTYTLETSPGKFQAGIVLERNDADAQNAALVDRVMAALAAKGRGNDPAGNSRVRYGRLPVGMNTKARASGPFRVRLWHWRPKHVLSLANACAVFGIDLDEQRAHRVAKPAPDAYRPDPAIRTPEGVTEGGRDDAVHKYASSLRARDVDYAEAEVLVLAKAASCTPPLPKNEAIKCLKSAWKYPPGKSEAFRVAAAPAQIETEGQHWLEAIKSYQAPLHHWKQPPPIRWAVEGLIREGTVGTLIAPGATGKTTLLITLGICHALGEPFMGRTVKQGSFLLLSLDDSQEDLDAAVGMVLGSMHLNEQQVQTVAAFLRVISLQGKSGPRSFNLPGSPGAPNPEMQQALMDACLAIPALVGLCVDTLRQFAGGPTNAEEVIMQVSAICASVATRTGAYVSIPHHTGKAGARDDQGDMYAGSGSAAIADNARFVLVLETVRERSDLTRLAADVQQDQNAGLCDVLRLTSRRGSIRHKAAPDLYIVRRGFALQVAATQEAGTDARTLQILAAIAAEVEAGRKPSKNGLFRVLGGNRNKVFAEIDDLIECGLVAGISAGKGAADSEGGIESGINKSMAGEGLTPAGAAFLKARKGL